MLLVSYSVVLVNKKAWWCCMFCSLDFCLVVVVCDHDVACGV